MTDGAEPAVDGQPTAEQAALAAEVAARGGTASPTVTTPAAAGSPTDERPELAVGAAFAGGLVLALLLKRVAR